MLKFKLYYDKDAEEAWLKKMSLDGWEFKKFFLGFYTFGPCKPGEYNYQIDLLDNWKGDTVDYSSFMSNVGVQVVGQWWRWVYLKKKASDGPFEMYTDVESKIAQYRRIGNLFKVLSFVEAICFFVELIGAVNTGDYIVVIFTILLAGIFLTMLRIVWKCKLKIERFKREEM